MMYVVESGIVTCHMDFLRLQHRMQLPAVSKEVLAVAPVRYKLAGTKRRTCRYAWFCADVCLYSSPV